MAKKDNKKNNQSLASAVKSVGPVISQSEAKKIANQTGKSVAQVVAKATDKGVSVGSALVNQVSKAISAPLTGATTGIPSKTLEALAPLQNLQMNKGTVYSGYSTTTTPATQTRTVNGGSTSTPASTVYNPIVLPRNMPVAGGGASGGGGTSGGGGKSGTQGYIDKQFDAYKDWAQTTIDGLTSGQDILNQQIIELQARNDQNVADIVSTFNDQIYATQSAADEQISSLQNLMMQQDQQFQQASQAQQQQAAAAQAAYEEQRRQAEALARAYVPNLEPTVSSLSYGTNKRQQQEEDANLLSSLTMLAPTSSVSPALAGLQIA